MVYLRIHANRNGPLVAACDKALLGRVFRDGRKVIDLDRHRGFYQGDEATEAEVQAALRRRFASANLVGEGATAIAIREGLAESGDVLYIARVPYIHIYRI